MKIIILTLVSFLMNGCVSQENKSSKMKETLFEIVFADGFKSDGIVFKVNEMKIAEPILFSDESDGLTSIGYRIFRNRKGNTAITNLYKKDEEYPLQIDGKIIISILLNGEKFDCPLNKTLGKYVIVELINGRINFKQQNDKPIFD